MKLSTIGTLTLGKFSTIISVTELVKKEMKSHKISLSTLIPPAWIWYDSELLDLIDENGDGKPDEKFGKDFKIIYFANSEKTNEFEKIVLTIEKTTIKDLNLKYIVLKNQEI